jgi:4-hydroxy-4-methyl-2-oxoglutarate aldolase
MSEFPEWLAATLASDATEGQGVLPNNILPLRADTRVVGPARVVLMSQDDNLAVRKVLEAPPAPGTVLVVAGGSTSRTALRVTSV